nr:hypothetical protein [Tanacetum cinerariifolium]
EEIDIIGYTNVSKRWHSSVLLTKIQEAIHTAHDLMDQVIRAKVAKDANNKRKWEDDHGGNSCQQQNKRHEVVRVYAAGSSDNKGKKIHHEVLPIHGEHKELKELSGPKHHYGYVPPQ